MSNPMAQTHSYSLRSRKVVPTPEEAHLQKRLDVYREQMKTLDAALEACKPNIPPVSLLEKSLEAVEGFLAAKRAERLRRK